MLGEMARETLFSSLRVVPEKLKNSGYSFAFENVEEALRDILKS
jgi:NAD dependent epimerase/dehydratase family enzyme